MTPEALRVVCSLEQDGCDLETMTTPQAWSFRIGSCVLLLRDQISKTPVTGLDQSF